MSIIKLENLNVGYGKKVIVQGVNLDIRKGKMTCILGPNGSGKTTIIKTIAKIIDKLHGGVLICSEDSDFINQKNMAKKLAVVLTNKMDLADMTGFDVVSMGRYIHTNFFGILTEKDKQIVLDCLEKCKAGYLKDRSFQQMSDGEKQKVLIARSIAQSSEILILDEPTSHLDIKYKLEILSVLKKMCLNEGKTIICTLHEPDLAIKGCDDIILVKDDTIIGFGTVEEIIKKGILEQLYGFESKNFDTMSGLIEFVACDSKEVFVVGANNKTPSFLRNLNKNNVGFGIGILHENDICTYIAQAMGSLTFTKKPHRIICEEDAKECFEIAKEYKTIVVAKNRTTDLNIGNKILTEMLEYFGKTVIYQEEIDCESFFEQVAAYGK